MERSVERSYHVDHILARKYATKMVSVMSHAHNHAASRNLVDIWIQTPAMHHFNARKLRPVNQSFRYPVLVVASSKKSNVTLQDRRQGIRRRRLNATTHAELEEWL